MVDFELTSSGRAKEFLPLNSRFLRCKCGFSKKRGPEVDPTAYIYIHTHIYISRQADSGTAFLPFSRILCTAHRLTSGPRCFFFLGKYVDFGCKIIRKCRFVGSLARAGERNVEKGVFLKVHQGFGSGRGCAQCGFLGPLWGTHR